MVLLDFIIDLFWSKCSVKHGRPRKLQNSNWGETYDCFCQFTFGNLLVKITQLHKKDFTAKKFQIKLICNKFCLYYSPTMQRMKETKELLSQLKKKKIVVKHI